ncbi:hypothetical protein AB1283_01085 [Bacillus sp. S13(2024)]|uniref:hypothetical protein n=1 Tax=Bacillus sp. S13(2024) TaxID=3162885 RepID=UPI003D1F39A4
MVNFKFNVGEEVNLEKTGVRGTIKQRKYEYVESKQVTTEEIKYFVHTGGYTTLWYKEDELRGLLEVAPETEEGIKKLMVNINLKDRNFDMVKNWSEFE